MDKAKLIDLGKKAGRGLLAVGIAVGVVKLGVELAPVLKNFELVVGIVGGSLGFQPLYSALSKIPFLK